jgi:hypothetical protein
MWSPTTGHSSLHTLKLISSGPGALSGLLRKTALSTSSFVRGGHSMGWASLFRASQPSQSLPRSPTLVFSNGTCRVPILHPPAPKILFWNVSRSNIAPCGCKVATPGTRRECRSVPTPWNPSRTLNRAPPSSKLSSWNASRLSHSSSHSIRIMRIEYNHVVGLWRSTPLGFLRSQSAFREGTPRSVTD